MMMVLLSCWSILLMNKLLLISSPLSAYQLSRVVNLIEINIIFMCLQAWGWVPTSCFPFISTIASLSLIFEELILFLLLLGKHSLILRVIELCCIHKELLFLLHIWWRIVDDLLGWHYHLLLNLLLKAYLLWWILLIEDLLWRRYALNKLSSNSNLGLLTLIVLILRLLLTKSSHWCVIHCVWHLLWRVLVWHKSPWLHPKYIRSLILLWW